MGVHPLNYRKIVFPRKKVVGVNDKGWALP